MQKERTIIDVFYSKHFCCCCLKRGETPLLRAAKNGHLEVVKKLISAGASVDISDKVSNPVRSAHLCYFHVVFSYNI